MKHIPGLLLAALLPLSAYAGPTPPSAAPAPAATTHAVPPALQPLVQNGGRVVRSFPAVDGLTGWVVMYQDHMLVIYTTSSGNYGFSSPLVDKGGVNLTQQYYTQYVLGPAAEDAAAVLAKDPYLVDEGSAVAPLLYVYADPNCIYCNKLWTQLRSYVQAGKVHVRWAMVSFLKKTSPGRAAAILAAKDRAAALAQDESKFDAAQEEGAIPELSPVPAELQAVIDTHNKAMAMAGGQGTPLMVYRKGGKWVVSEGWPQDLKAFIAALDPSK
jgi:thiol:disulfide interchange protein DsbG